MSAFYEKSVAEIKESKGAIDAEIKELEAQINGKSASSANQSFEKISYAPKARARLLGALKKVAKVVKKIAIAIIAACEASGGFCD